MDGSCDGSSKKTLGRLRLVPVNLATRQTMGKETKRNAKSKQDRAAAADKAAEAGTAPPPVVVNATAGAQYHRHSSEKQKLGTIKKKKPRVSLSRMKAGRRHLAK